MNTWDQWEDYQSGLYGAGYTLDHVHASWALLTDPDAFREAAREMTREWPHSAHHNLDHMWSGRNAWVGQATCLYSCGSPGVATREAWAQMTTDQRREANQVAAEIRQERERSNRDASETLFGL